MVAVVGHRKVRGIATPRVVLVAGSPRRHGAWNQLDDAYQTLDALIQNETVPGKLRAEVLLHKALLLREWYGYTSDNDYAGTGRRVYENLDADTGEGYSFSSSAFPMYGWGALNGFIGLVHNGFYSQVPARS